MNAHVLQTRTRKGTTIELGHVGSFEAAVRLQRALEDGLGEPFHVTILEKHEIRVRSLTYAEARGRGFTSSRRARTS